jgi:hypothetical protein
LAEVALSSNQSQMFKYTNYYEKVFGKTLLPNIQFAVVAVRTVKQRLQTASTTPTNV